MLPPSPAARRIRVVTLVDGIGISGGAERLARDIASRLDSDRFESTFCVTRWTAERSAEPGAKEALDQLRAAGVSFVGLPRRGPVDLAGWRPLIAHLRRNGVDILHSHKFGSNVWAAVLGTIFRVPAIIAHEHTWSFEGQPLRRFLDRRLIGARADAFLAVSRADRRRMIEIEHIEPAKVIFVPNGIPSPPAPSGHDVRRELGIPASAPVVGAVGVLRPQKAFEDLLEAAAKLKPRFPDLRVLIAGDGPERSRLEEEAGRLGLRDTVLLLGQRGDIPAVLAAFDVAASTSKFEGTPLAVLEYMEAGLPIVATRVGGVPDLIDPGRDGELVDAGDVDAAVRAIGGLLGDRERARRLGTAARARRRSEFDISSTVKAIEAIYSDLTAGRQPAGIAA